jgi:hypothetical protein
MHQSLNAEMNEKKKIERFYLERFLELLRERPREIHGDETPDFIVIFPQKKVGVEVTGYHSPLAGEGGRDRRALIPDWRIW